MISASFHRITLLPCDQSAQVPVHACNHVAAGRACPLLCAALCPTRCLLLCFRVAMCIGMLPKKCQSISILVLHATMSQTLGRELLDDGYVIIVRTQGYTL